MSPADHYGTLGVTPAADDAQIRKAFRSLSRLHHPDMGGNTDTYEAISVAYSVLSDPVRRRKYDLDRGLATASGADRGGFAAGAGGAAGGATRGAGPAGARAQRAGNGTGTAAGSAAGTTGGAAGGSRRPGAGSGPALRDRPVKITAESPGSLPAAEASTPVRGTVPRRGLLDRTRDERNQALRELLRGVAREVPAARLLLGVEIPRAGRHDAVLAAGHRLVVVDALPTPDVPHAWDGRSLRVAGRVVHSAPVDAAAHALERAVPGVRAEGVALLFVPGADAFRPVVDQVGPRSAPRGPANPARARTEVITFLAGGRDPDTVDLGVLGDVNSLLTTRR